MNLAERLHEEVRTQNKQIVIVGDAMTDVWVYGRISDCQENCTKFTERERCIVPGGAANAAKCLMYWSTRYVLYTHHDQFRPIKTRFVGTDGKIVFRYDDETRLLPIIDHDYIRRDALRHIQHESCHAVLLCDYDKGVLTPSFLKEVAATCSERGIPCVIDAKRHPDLYGGAIIKGNSDWAGRYGSADVTTYGCQSPVVHGVIAAGSLLPRVRCVNHVGAGDCFAAILTLALAHGFSLIEAAEVAHSAGRVYVQHPRNQPPRPEEVIEDMRTASIPPSHSAAPSHADAPGPVQTR